jgi:hypothetical protein
VRVVDLVEVAAVREALVLERLEQDLEALLVAVARLADGDAGLHGHPAVAAHDAELVAPVAEDVELRDLGGQDRRVVVRERVAQRAERDRLRALGGHPEQRPRVRRDRELREEPVLDDRVHVEPDAIGVLDLLEHLVVELPVRLAAVVLDLGVDAEPHGSPIVGRGRGCAGAVTAR